MYTYRFGNDEGHESITNLKKLKNCRWTNSFGLYFNRELVGTGTLRIQNFGNKWIHTEYMRLKHGFRKKGHGIYLYKVAILIAKKLGAKRIYASKRLNKNSRRMWTKKLSRYGFNVIIGKHCSRPCCHCKKNPVCYIEL